MSRPITLDQAKAQYAQRYTMDHVPPWAKQANPTNGKFYAPQYASDAEWYECTMFAGEDGLATKRHCYSQCPSWPVGQWLDTPFNRGA